MSSRYLTGLDGAGLMRDNRAMHAPTQIQIVKANPGNLIFRYMFALHLQEFLPSATIGGASLPELGLLHDAARGENPLKLPPAHQVDILGIVKAVEQGGHDAVEVDCFAMRLEYFEHNRSRIAYSLAAATNGHETADDEIVINVRAAEVLDGIHPDMAPAPISYYERVISESGLRPVFVGQLARSDYADEIRRRFPGARYLSGPNWIDDFQTVRNARHIVVAVSSFSWLAAWLSPRAERIYLPRRGMFNPAQRPDVDLCPREDARYVFTDFPVERYAASREQKDAILGLDRIEA